jgi:hypothetical protein
MYAPYRQPISHVIKLLCMTSDPVNKQLIRVISYLVSTGHDLSQGNNYCDPIGCVLLFVCFILRLFQQYFSHIGG